MLITYDTAKSLARIREDVPKACAAHQFGVLGTIDLKEKMKEKGVEYEGECVVFEVCNPKQAKRVLDVEPAVSTMLPCRISAYGAPGGKVRLATVKPTTLIGMFGGASPALSAVACEVEATLDAILRDAAR